MMKRNSQQRSSSTHGDNAFLDETIDYYPDNFDEQMQLDTIAALNRQSSSITLHQLDQLLAFIRTT